MTNAQLLLLIQQTVERINNTIALHHENDNCTECYGQGLEDAVDEFDFVINLLEDAANDEFYDSVINRKTNTSTNQLPLL